MKELMLFILTFVFLLGSASIYAKTKTYGERLCNGAKFRCVTVDRRDTWHSLFPNERERWMVMRLNRMNTPLRRGHGFSRST